jgi:hypothetical protein
MRILLGFSRAERRRWGRLWRALGQIAQLAPRETEIVADTARRGIYRNFERESAPSGEPWPELAPQTVEERRQGVDDRGIPFRVGGHHPILVRTHDLQESFTNPRHPRNVTRVTRGKGLTEIVLSARENPQTPGRIPTLHAGGTTESGARVPPRPFIGLSHEAQEQVGEQARRVVWQRVERLRGL